MSYFLLDYFVLLLRVLDSLFCSHVIATVRVFLSTQCLSCKAWCLRFILSLYCEKWCHLQLWNNEVDYQVNLTCLTF